MSAADFNVVFTGLSLALLALIGHVSASGASESIPSENSGITQDDANSFSLPTEHRIKQEYEEEELFAEECKIQDAYFTEALERAYDNMPGDGEVKFSEIPDKEILSFACKLCCEDESRKYNGYVRYAADMDAIKCYCLFNTDRSTIKQADVIHTVADSSSVEDKRRK